MKLLLDWFKDCMLFEHTVVLFSARWLDYKAVGKRLFGTRFIAFKVPLKQVRLIPPSLFLKSSV